MMRSSWAPVYLPQQKRYPALYYLQKTLLNKINASGLVFQHSQDE